MSGGGVKGSIDPHARHAFLLRGENHARLVVRGNGVDKFRLEAHGPFSFLVSTEEREDVRIRCGYDKAECLVRMCRLCGIIAWACVADEATTPADSCQQGKCQCVIHFRFSFNWWLSVAFRVSP